MPAFDVDLDYYAILGVSPADDGAQIRKAYHELARKFHPDLVKEQTEKDRRELMFKKINSANEVLSNKELRKDYDAARGTSTSSSTTPQSTGSAPTPPQNSVPRSSSWNEQSGQFSRPYASTTPPNEQFKNPFSRPNTNIFEQTRSWKGQSTDYSGKNSHFSHTSPEYKPLNNPFNQGQSQDYFPKSQPENQHYQHHGSSSYNSFQDTFHCKPYLPQNEYRGNFKSFNPQASQPRSKPLFDFSSEASEDKSSPNPGAGPSPANFNTSSSAQSHRKRRKGTYTDLSDSEDFDTAPAPAPPPPTGKVNYNDNDDETANPRPRSIWRTLLHLAIFIIRPILGIPFLVYASCLTSCCFLWTDSLANHMIGTIILVLSIVPLVDWLSGRKQDMNSPLDVVEWVYQLYWSIVIKLRGVRG